MNFSDIKKSISMVVFLSILLSLTSCQAETNAGNTSTAAEIHPDFLTETDWVYHTNCDETIHFGADGSFSYYCACGSPVGDYDLYDTYTYDASTSEITLHPEGDDNTIKVLQHEDGKLLLEFPDGTKEFALCLYLISNSP